MGLGYRQILNLQLAELDRMCPKMLIYDLSSPCRGFGINDGRLATATRTEEHLPDDEARESKTNGRLLGLYI